MRSSLLFAIFVILTILSSSSFAFSSEIDSNQHMREWDDFLALVREYLKRDEKFYESQTYFYEKLIQSHPG